MFLIAAFLVVALATATPFFLAARSQAGEQRQPVLRPCPPFGSTVAGSVIISAEEWANGIYPIGRRFVILKCRR